MKVLLIIPACNEAQNLPGLLTELRQYRDRYDVVVVDDASSDHTSDVARSYDVPVLRLAANLGIGGAVQTGFKYATLGGYDVAIQIDGDGQHDPAYLDRLVEPIANGVTDCVIGSRYMKDQPDHAYQTPLPRRLGMLFSTGLLYLASGVLITDTTSGLRALNARAFEYFAREYPVDHPEAEALLMLIYQGFRIKELPVKMRGRISGRSSFTFLPSILYPLRVLIGFLGVLIQSKRK